MTNTIDKETVERLASDYCEQIRVEHSEDEIGDSHIEYSFDEDDLNRFTQAILSECVGSSEVYGYVDIDYLASDGYRLIYVDGTKPKNSKALFTHPQQDDLQAEITRLEALSVENIMIDVVAGDGSGYEVYAKSVAEVEKLLSDMSLKIDDNNRLRKALKTVRDSVDKYPAAYIRTICVKALSTIEGETNEKTTT